MKRWELTNRSALSLVGCGYAWGASGQSCTRALLEKLAKQYPKQTNLLAVCPKWIGKRVYDCGTLVRAALAAGGLSVCSGATSLWKGDYWQEKGSGTPPGPCVVFNESGSGMGHVGLYLGDGTVVDARGSAAGVIRSEYGSRAWSHFAVPCGYEDELDADEAIVAAESGSTVRLRRLASESAGTLRRVPLGESVTVLEWGGEFSHVLDAGGLSGWMMTRFLRSQTGVRYDVSLEGASESERAALVAACPRVTVIARA